MKNLFFIFLLAFISFNCEKNAPDPVSLLPTITTAAITSITANTALSGGNITSAGGSAVTARGVCWGTVSNPVVGGSNTINGSGTGIFASPITGLTANTTYYIRAYATNSTGTTYGNQLSFISTTTSTALPTVTTTALTSITTTTAASGGNVTADGGATVTARGVCWATTANPVATGNHTTDGTGTGIFTSAITGLAAGTTYHVRAYATNSVGTAYGGDSVFTTITNAVLPTLITATVTSITATTGAGGGNVTTDGGATVTARGVCWSTTANPVASGSHTTDGTGTGIFTSAITVLTANTTYHVRAYATNIVGTAYGADMSFTTTTASAPDVYVAGFEFNSNNYSVATSWKNGIASYLTGGTNTAQAHSVYVAGTDVYVAGTDFGNATYWKNGTSNSLGVSSAIYSVFVSGPYVLLAGQISNRALFWLNGTPVSLTSGVNGAANSVFGVGTDVYAAGYETNGTNNIAKFWKNSYISATSLTNGLNDAMAYSIFVSGTDIYVAGYEYNGTNNVAKIWKNGVATSLTDGTNYAYAKSVFVSGADVYVAGFEVNGGIYVAKLWKNAVVTSLTSGFTNAFAESVYVLGSDVYVTGNESNGTTSIAKIWKNGVATSLTNGSTNASGYSIFVK